MKYFTLPEFSRSDTAKRLNIDNTIHAGIAPCVVALVDKVLDPLREAWGRPIIVTSGYRSPALNRAVGGAARSHHLQGKAADITAGTPTDNRKLFELAIRLNLPFTQLIDEKNYKWLHISYDPSDVRRQVLHLS